MTSLVLNKWALMTDVIGYGVDNNEHTTHLYVTFCFALHFRNF